jgi:filamentous hemagglutinin family protein
MNRNRSSRADAGTNSRPALFSSTAMIVLIGSSLALAPAAHAQGLPSGGTVTGGDATISAGPTAMTVNQTSQNTAINWQTFNIAAGNSVQFVQPNSRSVALNRVVGGDSSAIFGTLSANGQVFLINPNGVLFGRGAQVNVGGLVASTLDVTDSDFMAGRYSFSGASRAPVLNQGSINADGGYVALLGANVRNDGLIQANMGSVALAAGSAITLDLVGDGLLSVVVDRGAVEALTDNAGVLRANGGQVVMTAQAAGQLLKTVVNNSGVIEAQTLRGRDGRILLLADMHGGTVNVAGVLDASAPNGGDGGFIETSAA